MATAALVGSTGLVGSFILSTLRASPAISSVDIVARRNPPSPETLTSTPNTAKLTSFINADTTKWAAHLKSLSPPPSIFFSSLATTRAAAGGFSAQYKLEHDLNVELARAAKDAGTKVYVLISAARASKDSSTGYLRMKGEIEENIKALEFEQMVIVRPGLIAGAREESRPMEAVVRGVASVAGWVSTRYLKDGWAQDADVIARAAVSAGITAAKGEAPGSVWLLQGPDIVRLGRTEWQG